MSTALYIFSTIIIIFSWRMLHKDTEGQYKHNKAIHLYYLLLIYSIGVAYLFDNYVFVFSEILASKSEASFGEVVSLLVVKLGGDKSDSLRDAIKESKVMLLSIIGLFVPILVTLWNNFNKEFLDEYKYLTEHNHKDQIETLIDDVTNEYEAISEISRFVRRLFLFMIWLIILLIFIILYIDNYSAVTLSVNKGILIAIAKAIQFVVELILLLFVFLLLVHVWLVQPIIGKIRRIDLIPLREGENNGKK